jgi:hypothetical protein
MVADLEPEGSARRAMFGLVGDLGTARLALLRGQAGLSQKKAHELAKAIRAVPMDASDTTVGAIRSNFLRLALGTEARAALQAGDYPAAVAAARERKDLPPNLFSQDDPELELSRSVLMEAHARARLGESRQARELVHDRLSRYRESQGAGATGLSFTLDLAYALYVAALVEPDAARRDALLREATTVLGGLPPAAQQLVDVRGLLDWIDAAARSPVGA